MLKTYIFNALSYLIIALDYSGQLHLDQFLPHSLAWIAGLVAAVNVLLHWVALNTPVNPKFDANAQVQAPPKS